MTVIGVALAVNSTQSLRMSGAGSDRGRSYQRHRADVPARGSVHLRLEDQSRLRAAAVHG